MKKLIGQIWEKIIWTFFLLAFWIWIWQIVYLHLNSKKILQKRFERGWSGKYGETNCWKLFLVGILKVNLEKGLPSFKFKPISAKEIWDRDCMFWANTSLSPSWALFIQQFPLLLNRKQENISLSYNDDNHLDWLSERQTAEELKKKMRGEEEDDDQSVQVAALVGNRQLAIGNRQLAIVMAIPVIAMVILAQRRMIIDRQWQCWWQWQL